MYFLPYRPSLLLDRNEGIDVTLVWEMEGGGNDIGLSTWWHSVLYHHIKYLDAIIVRFCLISFVTLIHILKLYEVGYIACYGHCTKHKVFRDLKIILLKLNSVNTEHASCVAYANYNSCTVGLSHFSDLSWVACIFTLISWYILLLLDTYGIRSNCAFKFLHTHWIYFFSRKRYFALYVYLYFSFYFLSVILDE